MPTIEELDSFFADGKKEQESDVAPITFPPEAGPLFEEAQIIDSKTFKTAEERKRLGEINRELKKFRTAGGA